MYIKTIIIALLITPFMISTSYSQGIEVGTKDKKVIIGEDDPKNQRRNPIDYENFELTDENLPWAREKVKQEKKRAERELKEGKITQEEFERRMGLIAEAKKKIKAYENDPKNNGALVGNDEDIEIEYDPNDTELVSQKEAREKRQREKAERDRKKREDNIRKGNRSSLQASLDNLKREKEKLESDKKAGKITVTEYSERLRRIEVSEKNIEAKIKEIDDQGKPGARDGENVNEKDKSTRDIDNKDPKKDLQEAVMNADNRVLEARKRVVEEKAQMEKDLKSGKLSQSDYNSKMIRISRVEKAIEDLEKKTIEAKNN